MEDRELIRAAIEARRRAYTPYSHYQVGAALLTEGGKLYRGCNIENAAFSPTCCAERTAFFKAVSEGETRFSAIAIVAGPEGELLTPPTPCGVCRQVMMEFCDPETFRILLAQGPEDYHSFTLRELLPLGFGPKDL